jgi:hypothetical protein
MGAANKPVTRAQLTQQQRDTNHLKIAKQSQRVEQI